MQFEPQATFDSINSVKDGDVVRLTVGDGNLVLNGEAVRIAAE